MSWAVRAVQLPDGDEPVDLWVDAAGCLSADPVPGAQRLPGTFVAPGLVDAHAHPAVGRDAGAPVALSDSETLGVLAEWAAAGVGLVRDVGSPGGSVLQLHFAPGLPRVQAAGRFLAPAGRYFPVLLPEEAPEHLLTELALAELARGARWVKVIADFPVVSDGVPSGPSSLTYSLDAVAAMVAAVHAAGGRVAAHVNTDAVAELVQAGVDSVEHGRALDEHALRLMAQTGAAWTPTLCAVLKIPDSAPEPAKQRVAEYGHLLREMLPLAHRIGVPILAGTDTAGTIAEEVALLAGHGLDPAAALAAATTTGYRVLGEPAGLPGRPVTLVTYSADPRADLAVLSSPSAVLIDGVRVR
jgi:imidazolonepropionase-like amidohydrolase